MQTTSKAVDMPWHPKYVLIKFHFAVKLFLLCLAREVRWVREIFKYSVEENSEAHLFNVYHEQSIKGNHHSLLNGDGLQFRKWWK